MLAEIINDEPYNDYFQYMTCLTWREQIEYIVEMDLDLDNENLTNRLIKWYESTNKRMFNFDKLRWTYAFLKDITLAQALHLYDALTDVIKSDVIDVIKSDFPHLSELTYIHESFEINSTDMITLTIQ